jgi:hypothetical protein
MGYFIERWIHYPIATLVAFAFLHLRGYSVLPTNLSDLFATALTVASIGAGFLFTTSSILMTITNRRIVKTAQKSGLYRRIMRYVIGATKWCLVLALVSAVGVVKQPPVGEVWGQILLGVWVFLAAATATATYRVLHIFSAILDLVSNADE